jgi:hypothetical protein
VWRFDSRGLKQVVQKADQSSPSSAEVKNEWSYTSAAPVHIQGMYMTKFCIKQKFEQYSTTLALFLSLQLN